MKFFIKKFFIICDQIMDLVTLTGEILNGKLRFLCSVYERNIWILTGKYMKFSVKDFFSFCAVIQSLLQWHWNMYCKSIKEFQGYSVYPRKYARVKQLV